jgi:hypothetical protein
MATHYRRRQSLEHRASLLTSLLPVLLARSAIASQVDPKETFVWQHGDTKFVPSEGLPPRRLARRRLAQEADRALIPTKLG